MKKRVYYRGYGIVEIPEGASPEQIWAILDAKKSSDSGEDLMPVFEQPRKPEEPGFLSQVAKNVKAGVAAIPGALINTAAALPDMIGAVTAGEPEAGPGYGANVGLHQLSAPMLEAAKFIRENPVSKYLSEVPQDQKDDAGNPVIGRQVGDVAGQVAGMMIPGAAGMRGAKALSYILGASQQASQVQQDADRKRAAGMAIAPEDSAAAAVAAMPSTALDAFNIGRIGRFLPGYAKHEALKQAAEISGQSYLRPALETGLSALVGAAVESGQQLAANAAIKSTYDPAQALDEGLMDNAIAGGGADAGLELINQILLRKTAKGIHTRHQNKAAERARQSAPEVLPGDEEAIGIRSQIDGTPEVKYVQQRRPTRNEILDELSLGLYGKPLSELDAQRGMHLDRSYEDLRKMGMSDQEVIDHLTQPIDLTAEPQQTPQVIPPALAPDAPPVRLTDEGAIDASAVQYPSFLDQIIAQEPALYERLQGQDVVNSLLANPSEPRGVTPNKPRPKPPVQNAILTDEGAIATDQQPTEIRREGIRPMPTREQIIAEATAARQQAEQLKAQRRAEADAIRLQKKQSQVTVPETGIANERDADARQRVSRELFGRNFDQLTPEQITEVDSYRAEGLGEAVQPQEIAEINEFADLPFSRDQYRSALEVGRAAGVNTKPVSMTAVAKQAKVKPEVATQIINHMVTRGDAQLIDGKVVVDPTAMGPRYSLNTNTAPVKANTKDLGFKYLEKHSGYGNSWKTLNPNDIEKVSNLNRPDGVEIFRTRYWTAEGQPQGNIVPGKYYAAIPAENGKMNVVGKLEFDNPLRNNLDGGVLHLAVRPEFQKQGIGSALLSQGRNDGYSIKPVAGDLLSEDGARAINKANTQDTVIGRFSLEGRSQPTPSTNTVAAQRQLLEEGKQSELANSIFGEMQRLGVDDIVSTRLVDNLKVQPNAKGSYANQIISLAMAVQDPQAMKETLHHEAVHAMKAMGLFNDAEWNILQGALNPNSVLSDDERRQYGEIYGDRPDIIQEEAIARGLERYMAGQLSLDGPAKDIAAQKMSTLQRIGNAFKSNNMQSPADVASAFKSGEIGRREGNYAVNNAVANDQAGVDTERRISAESGATQDIPAVDAAKASEAVDPNSLSSMVKVDEEPEKFSFAGEKAYSSDPVASARIAASKEAAAKMEADGRDAKDIRLATGWFRNPYDKMWRHEISDERARLTQAFKDLSESKVMGSKKSLRLDEALDHPELFKAYPELKDIKVIKKPGFMDFFGALQGSFDPKTNTINLTPYSKDPESTLIHEVQHWIQEKEGFASGGNADIAIKAAPKSAVDKAIKSQLTKKESQATAEAKYLREQKDALSFANENRDGIETYNRLRDAAMELHKEYKLTNTPEAKQAWLSAEDQSRQQMALLRSKAAGLSDPWMLVARAATITPDSVKRTEDAFVKLQQEINGLKSGDPDTIQRVLKSGDTSYELYKNIAGEIEARDVQARRLLSDWERDEKEPLTSESIPAEDAIVVRDTGESNSQDDTRYSLPQKPVNTFGKEVFAAPDERGGLRRALDEQSAVRGNSVIVNKSDRKFLPGERLATRIETIDKRAASEEASRFLKHRPIESAIAAIRNADQSRTFAANSLESGPLEIKGDGPFHGAIGVKEGSTRGAAAVINDAREKGQYDRLKYYIAAERAKRLRPQGKEKLITPQQEAEWLKYGKDPEVKKFADELKAYNDQMVDFLLQSEVIDKATADKFKQGYFMAFYREDPNTKAVASQKSSSLTTQPQFVELQGSDQLIADPIENLVKNTNMITEMAMNNVAKQRIIRDGLKLGFAKQLKKSETSPTAVHVNIKGKKVSFEITDPVMYRSISAVNEPLDFWMKVAKMPSDLLRTAVTKTPIFMPRNMLRDSQHIHSLGYTRAPFMNVFTDTQKAFSDTGTMKKLEDMGVLSGSIQGEGAIGTAQVIRNKVRHGDNPLTRAWKTYSDFIDRGEAVNRITVYDHVYNREFESEMKANGGDAKKAKQVAEAAAQYETREVLNFGRHGANKWVRFVNAMIPFQNARLQGIDVLYRALKEGRGLNPEQKKQAVTRLVAQSIISMLYTAAVAGTAAYQAATKEERRDNYIIPLGEGKDPLKIPIAYEFGFLSKIIPEIAMQEILKAQDGKDIMKAFSDFMVEGGGATAEFLGKTSKIIDVPQNVKPIFEASINKDLFRERDIEPMWMQKLNPKYRYDDSTSELAKAVASYLPEGSEVSPAKIDHVLKGYFGTMGTYAMDLIDFITSPDPVGKLQDIKAIAEEGKYSKLPLFSPLFQRQDGAAALVDAMEIRNRAERDANTLKMAIRQGADISDAEREKLRKGAEIAKQTSAYDQRMSQLNRMMQQTQALMRNGQLTPSEGRKTLEEIRRRKIELSQPIVKRYKDAVK